HKGWVRAARMLRPDRRCPGECLSTLPGEWDLDIDIGVSRNIDIKSTSRYSAFQGTFSISNVPIGFAVIPNFVVADCDNSCNSAHRRIWLHISGIKRTYARMISRKKFLKTAIHYPARPRRAFRRARIRQGWPLAT